MYRRVQVAIEPENVEVLVELVLVHFVQRNLDHCENMLGSFVAYWQAQVISHFLKSPWWTARGRHECVPLQDVALCAGCATHGDAIDLDGRDADTDRHRLSILAAGADAFVELQIVADH